MAKTLKDHNYNSIDATIIADSKNEYGQRLTTFVLTFPRHILAEFNTHRMISRNSASSRAIPFDRMVENIRTNPFIPIKWMKDHSGMQGTEYFEDESYKETIADKTKVTLNSLQNIQDKGALKATDVFDDIWLDAMIRASNRAKSLNESGVTKQFCNRLLEPFKWHTALASATEWENFFALRAEDGAEIHIQELAYKMLEKYNESEPQQLQGGEWHIPFGSEFDSDRLEELQTLFWRAGDEEMNISIEDLKVRIATARCARVSYENFEGGDDYQKDIDLHDRLAKYGHWSPFEHPASSMSKDSLLANRKTYFVKNLTERIQKEVDREISDVFELDGGYAVTEYSWSGNFRGFFQYRKMFEGENRNDPRVQEK